MTSLPPSQLGLGDNRDRNRPIVVRALLGKGMRGMSCGQNHTAAVTKFGKLFTCGWGQHGRLGHGDEDARNTFVREWLAVGLAGATSRLTVVSSPCRLRLRGCALP